MNADAWILLAVSATVIWGGLAAAVVSLGRHHEATDLTDEEEAS